MIPHIHNTILLNAIGHSILILDPDQNIIEANVATTKLTGLSSKEMVGKKCYELFHATSSTPPENCPLMKMKNSKNVETEEMLVETLNRKFLVSCTPIYDSTGKLEKIIHIAVDITERKLAMDLIQRSETQYRTLIEMAVDGIVLGSSDGIITKANSCFCEMVGIKQENIIGKYVSNLPFAKESIEKSPLRFDLLQKGEIVVSERTIRRPDGSEITIEMRTKMMPDKGYQSIYRDITERKQAEEALFESKELYQTFINSTDDIAFLKDDNLRYLITNKANADFFGKKQEEIIGLTDFDIMDHKSANFCMASDKRAIQENKIIISEENVGDQIFETRKFPVKMRNGKIGVGGYVRDITKRKIAEEKIKTLLTEKEILLKEVHHRIKNNMNAVAGLMQLQLMTLKEPSAIEALKDARSRVLSTMLLYDKLYCSGDFKDISFKEYLSPLIDEIINNFPNKNTIKLEKYIDDFILEAKKVSHIGIIVNELLTNIMKYAFEGRENGTIIVSVSLKDNHVTLTIHDDGNTIPESIDITKSCGFGLQLVQMMTQQLHGTIKVERNNGTKFMLEFYL